MICKWCGYTINEVDECIANEGIGLNDGLIWPSVPYPEEAKCNCECCGVAPGNFHHAKCGRELCPRCNDQLNNCGCLYPNEE